MTVRLVKMKFQHIIIFTFVCISFVLADEEVKEHHHFTPKFPKNLESINTLKRFVKLVEEHDMNVTIIISKTTLDNDGDVDEVIGLRLKPFPNDKHLTSSEFTQEDASKILKIAKQEKLTAATFSMPNGDNSSLKMEENNPLGPLESVVISSKFYDVADYSTDLKDSEGKPLENLAFHFSLINDEGKETEVYGAGAFVSVYDDIGFTDEEKEKVAEIVEKVVLSTDHDIISQALTQHLDYEFPDHNWNAFEYVGEDYWLGTEKKANVLTEFGQWVIFTV